jgi:ubiquinone/menaquinone biosynthesis C-methylase UbiE
MVSKEEVLKANIEVHTKLADLYNLKEPTYKPENTKRVRRILRTLKKATWGKDLIDLGCGTGFIIDIAKEYFDNIIGIDITPSMLNKVDKRHPNWPRGSILTHQCNCEELPFPDYSFDVCTAYAFLHHLHSIKPVLKEAYRVLKLGGFLYTDQDPNKRFYNAITSLKGKNYSSIIKREIRACKGDVFETDYIDKKTFKTSEYIKFKEGGFLAEDLREEILSIGFKRCTINYVWLLGEGSLIHNINTKSSAVATKKYIKDILPLSSNLFKYISIVAVK